MSEIRHIPDPALVERLRAGDVSALSVVMARHTEPLIAYADALLGSADWAQDVVQETFIRVWERRRDLDPSQPVGPYLYRAVRNRALDALRGERRRMGYHQTAAAVGSVGPVAGPGPGEALESDELSRRLARAIAQLPHGCREVFVMVRRGGLTYQEAADILGISVSTVKTQMGKAMAALSAASIG